MAPDLSQPVKLGDGEEEAVSEQKREKESILVDVTTTEEKNKENKLKKKEKWEKADESLELHPLYTYYYKL